MNYDLTKFPSLFKKLILAFVISLTAGYFAGFKFIFHSTDLTPVGVEESYLGNEDDEDAEILKFRKSETEILTTIHGHMISFSIIFLLMGLIIYGLPVGMKLKSVLIIEPFVSIILTFGGIYLLWHGIIWIKYIVMLSGMALTLTFLTDFILVLLFLFSKRKD